MEKDLLRLLQACIGVVVLLGTAILVFSLFPCMKSEVGAAWVQAIGSIAAIIGAWLGTRHQIQSAENVRHKDKLIANAETASICYTVSGYIYSSLSHIAHRLEENQKEWSFRRIGTERVETLLEMIGTIMQKDLTPRLFEYFLPLQREVAYALTALNEYNKLKEVPSRERVQKAYLRVDAVMTCKRNLKVVLHAYSERADRPIE